MNIIIYGAQAIAMGTYEALTVLYPEVRITNFVVTEKGINPDSIAGIPVIEFNKLKLSVPVGERDKIKILICTPENVIKEIEELLRMNSFVNYTGINSKIWAELQKRLHIRDNKFRVLENFAMGERAASIEVFKAKSVKDSAVDTVYKNPVYMHDIHVGAAGSEKKLADISDNTGANISEKNGDYSELTGLYWVWKNILESDSGDKSYYGYVQYRRILELNDDDIFRLGNNEIDVILPYPMPYQPDIEQHHLRYLTCDKWKIAEEVLQKKRRNDNQSLKSILKQNYMYNYNIIIAKKHVLRDYCEWMFDILFEIDNIYKDIYKDRRPDRSMGYISETLETLYFMNNSKFNIAHTGCTFLC